MDISDSVVGSLAPSSAGAGFHPAPLGATAGDPTLQAAPSDALLPAAAGRIRPNVLLGCAPRPSAGLGFAPALASLKTRPLEIALCFLAGDTDHEIASRLHISCSTVRRNLRSTMKALAVADRDALRKAYARGRTDGRRARALGAFPL